MQGDQLFDSKGREQAVWKICIDKDKIYRGVELIFPTQQLDVSKIIQRFSQNENVKKIIIFGSSVTSACNPWSDIDVFVELKREDTLRKPKVGVPIDLWTNYDVDDRLMQEISEKGVVVYER